MHQQDPLERWTIEKSRELFGIGNWGATYFDCNQNGHVVVTTEIDGKKVAVSIMDVISGIQERGMGMPVLLRFENLLDSQIKFLHDSFNSAIKQNNYKGEYRGVYPIKVNQQMQVIEEITSFGKDYHHGLEAGSKAELITAISMIQDRESCLICNGYKDEEFLDLGLFAQKMGYKVFFVIEMPWELSMVLERSRLMGIKPQIGLRLKISAKGGGHWTESGGDRSIFGLATTQVVQVVDQLKEEEMLDCLKLLHYHLGSQIPNIRDIRSAVQEASRFYVELVREGAPMGYLDLGGGLAVDYDGSKTNFTNSRNYTMGEYCSDIIEVVMDVLDDKEIPHPTIITESGRATVAYHSILLFNVLDVTKFEAQPVKDEITEEHHEMIQNMMYTLKNMTLKNLQECYNDSIYYRDEIQQLFRNGIISLREKSQAEIIFWNIINTIARDIKKMKRVPPELENLDTVLSDIYYCNFSVFQSLPDIWAIDQLFPVMPVHRLEERPSRKGILADITCDCDGKIDRFIDLHDVNRSLPLHELTHGEDYYLAVFLVGAYQETLGDLHNLMGDTNVVSIRINGDNSFELVKEMDGDSVSDVLSYVEYDPKLLLEKIRHKAEYSVQTGEISPSERHRIMKAYSAGLRGYTYFES